MTAQSISSAIVVSTAAAIGSRAKTLKGAIKALVKAGQTTTAVRLPGYPAGRNPAPVGRLNSADLKTLCRHRVPGKYSRTTASFFAGDDMRVAHTRNTGFRGRTGEAAHLYVTIESRVAITKNARAFAGTFDGKFVEGTAPEGLHFVLTPLGNLHIARNGSRSTRLVDARDVLLGLYSSGLGVWMPDSLAAEFGAIEFGLQAEARAEIRRKLEIVRNRPESASKREARAVRLLARISSATACLSDAREVGHCMPGITAWAESRGVALDALVPLRVLARDSDERARKVAIAVATKIWCERRVALAA